MKNLEEELKQALACKCPCPDFAARVMMAIEQDHSESRRENWRQWFARNCCRRFVPLLASLLIISGILIYRQHQHAVEGEAAKQKLLVAMHIAGSELQHAQQRVFALQGTEDER